MYLKFGFLGFQFLSLILTNIQDVYPFSQIPDTSYILRLKDEFYETSQPKSFNCRTVYCCALRCHQFQGCVAFSYKGQEVPSLPETSTSCYLISVDDTKKTLTIVKKPQMFYYEMDCDRVKACLESFICL